MQVREGGGLPIGIELIWKQRIYNNILAIEAWGVIKVLKIWLAEKYKDATIQMDPSYSIDLIQNNKNFKIKKKKKKKS
jgi:hypothetical protein